MKLGVVARADDRGLGIQTLEVCRHLHPFRVLVVAMRPDQERYVRPDISRYTALGLNVTVVPVERMGDPDVVAPWCAGLDVIYSAETFYDWRFCDIARAERARTVLHANPEFVVHHGQHQLPEPDVWWTATRWMHDHPNMPTIDRVVPMPVPIERWPKPRRTVEDQVSFLHIGGHMAMADRNGTRTVFEAMRRMTEKAKVTVTTQRDRLPVVRTPRNIEYVPVIGNQPDYWRLYEGHDVLVLPRRYGGLCLPAIEAAGAGLALVMSAVHPNGLLPAIPVESRRASSIDTPLGNIPPWSTDARKLAQVMDRLAADRELLWTEQEFARGWAENHSWDALRDVWWDALDDACG